MIRFSIFCIALLHMHSFAMHLEMSFIERPPHMYTNADGSMRGNIGKQMADIFDQAKVDISWIRYRPAQINKFLEEDTFDAFVATHNVVQDWDNFYTSEKPLVTLQFYFYYLEGKPSPDSLADTHNSTVAIPLSLSVLRGPMKDWLQTPAHNIKVIADVQNLEQAMPLLRTEVVDYYFSYVSPNTVSMRFSSRFSGKEVLTKQAYSSPMYLIVRKTVPQAKQIVASVDNVLK